jgi:hypothetical protein
MSEFHKSKPESESHKNIERSHEIISEQPKKNHESSESTHERAEKARDALLSAHELASETRRTDRVIDRVAAPAERRRSAPSKKHRQAALNKTMKDIRQDMPVIARAFSKVLHTRPVENASDFTASTLARPNALLAGSIAAFVTVAILYLLAKNYGYTMSGFETIGAFAVGWIIGIFYDLVASSMRRKD